METFGIYCIPLTIFIILFFGLVNKIPLFDIFIDGAKEGAKSCISIMPSLIGLITAISMLKASGALDVFTNFMVPIVNFLHIPPEVIPIALLRPISGSGSIALLDNMMHTYGADSVQGKIASLIMGGTETTFYTLTVYFGVVGIKNTKYTVYCALIGDIFVTFLSILIINYYN